MNGLLAMLWNANRTVFAMVPSAPGSGMQARCLTPGIVFFAAVIVSTVLLSQPSVGDILIPNSDNEPLHGLIESVDDSKVVFMVYQKSDHSFSRREWLLKDVKKIVRTVDQQRLARLTIDRLSDYRDLAEELSSLSNDPVARHIALRLTLLCLQHAASTDQGNRIRSSAAANLLTLAQSGEEREQFGLLAFLAGHPHNRRPQKPQLATPVAAVDKTMLEIVTAIRRENFVEASGLLDSELGKMAAAQWSASYSPKLLEDAVRLQKIDSELLARLLAVEIRIRYGDNPLTVASTHDAHRLANSHNQKPSGPRWIPTLQQISEFDLEQTEFKDGKWRNPK